MSKQRITDLVFSIGLFLSFGGLGYVALMEKYMPKDSVAAGLAVVFGLGVMGCMIMVCKKEAWNV